MQDFMDRVRRSFSRFMSGRYGGDQLGMVLIVVSLVLTLLSAIAGRWLNIFASLIAICECYRILSKNYAARRRENAAYLNAVAKPRAWVVRQYTKFVNRKTKAYVRCPHCNAEFALPKGKGRLRATCPKCGEKSEHTV